MLEVLGKTMLLFGAVAIGITQGVALRKRASCLRNALLALERLERELGFALPPVDWLLGEMQGACCGPFFNFLQDCATHFESRGEERLEEIWVKRLTTSPLPLTEGDKQVLQEVGAVLGRYDGERQQQAIQRIHIRLELQEKEAQEEARRMGKVYTVLGLSGGLFCVILL